MRILLYWGEDLAQRNRLEHLLLVCFLGVFEIFDHREARGCRYLNFDRMKWFLSSMRTVFAMVRTPILTVSFPKNGWLLFVLNLCLVDFDWAKPGNSWLLAVLIPAVGCPEGVAGGQPTAGINKFYAINLFLRWSSRSDRQSFFISPLTVEASAGVNKLLLRCGRQLL